MRPATPPDNEAKRLQALYRYEILDSPPERAFDDITAASASIFNTPISLVTFIDEQRQWFKSRQGLDISETHRDFAFCAHAIASDESFVVEDALSDDRFIGNPLVDGAPNIRFYAGAPITVADDVRLGTLCIIDTVPRTIDTERLHILETLRDAVVANLELRRLRDVDDVDSLLAMCAWCSRVRRDDDRRWISINSFLEAQRRVTHTICPDCREVVIEDS